MHRRSVEISVELGELWCELFDRKRIPFGKDRRLTSLVGLAYDAFIPLGHPLNPRIPHTRNIGLKPIAKRPHGSLAVGMNSSKEELLLTSVTGQADVGPRG